MTFLISLGTIVLTSILLLKLHYLHHFSDSYLFLYVEVGMEFLGQLAHMDSLLSHVDPGT